MRTHEYLCIAGRSRASRRHRLAEHGGSMSRTRRLTVLAELLSGHRFSSQEELAKALARSGAPVTQATLSRDLRSLGVAKRADPDGKPAYELPSPAVETFDRERRLLDLRAFVN